MDTIPAGWVEEMTELLKEVKWIVIAILLVLVFIEILRFIK